jgi:hypothetical protein
LECFQSVTDGFTYWRRRFWVGLQRT